MFGIFFGFKMIVLLGFRGFYWGRGYIFLSFRISFIFKVVFRRGIRDRFSFEVSFL